MTDPLPQEKEQQSVPATGVLQESASLGATLRVLRESRRISLSEASQRLKFTVRQIEALEAENWARLPSGMPLRGFVRNYARYLEADVDSVLVLLENQIGPTAPSNVMAAPSVAGSSVGADAELPVSAETPHRSWGWFFIILAILVVAGFYAIDRGWVPESWLIFDWLKAIANNE